MKPSVLRKKSKDFALRVVKMCQILQHDHKEYVLSNQIVRSGTSIGANIVEAYYAQSEADFTAKLAIARKEAGETFYWLELLRDSGYLSEDYANSMISYCDEILRILTSSIKTMKAKNS